MSRKSLSAPVQMLRRCSMMDIGEKPLGTTQTCPMRRACTQIRTTQTTVRCSSSGSQGMARHQTEGGEAFDATLPWPQCFWWRDRDRIVLLHEFLEVWPPMGHQGWEESIRDRVVLLWGKKFLWDGADMSDFRDDEMCGYRYLAALRSCPRYLRPGMSASLLEKVRQHVCQSQ